MSVATTPMILFAQSKYGREERVYKALKLHTAGGWDDVTILSVHCTPDNSTYMSMSSSYHLIMLLVSHIMVAGAAGDGVYRYMISKHDNCWHHVT